MTLRVTLSILFILLHQQNLIILNRTIVITNELHDIVYMLR